MLATISGSNSFASKQKLSKILNNFITQYGDMGVERYDGENTEVKSLISSVQSLPFLVEKRLIIVRDGALNKDIVAGIDTLLNVVNESNDLVFVEPKLDKRSIYYKTLKKRTDFKEFIELNNVQLAIWLVDEVKKHNGSIVLRDAQYLVERVGTNQQLLSNELNKLLTYERATTRKTIDLLTEPTPQSTIFKLLDAAFAGHPKKVLQIYAEQRQQKVEPLAILALIGWQLHILAIVKTAGQRSSSEIAQAAKLNPFVVSKTQYIAKNLTMTQLRRLIHYVSRIDVRLKSESIDPDEALQQLLLAITQN